MRRIVLLACTVLPFCLPTDAGAQSYRPPDPYRWCAQYSGGWGGGENCGFITWEQCQQTVHGMGGFCVENPFYTGPDRYTTGATRHRRYPPR